MNLFNKKHWRIILTAIIIIGNLFVANIVSAQDPNADDLIVEFEQTPLFGNEEGNFMPGDNVTRWVKVTNNINKEKRIAIEAINYPKNILTGNVSDNDLSRALLITIREKGGGGVYYGGGDTTLFDFYKNGETYLSDITAASGGVGGVNEYEFVISFPENRGDDWQGTTTKFDIIVGFQGEDDSGITLPPSSGGGLPPGLTISSEPNAAVSLYGVIITWTTNYFSTSQVIYAKKSEGSEPDELHTLDLYASNFGYAHAYPNPENFNKVTGHLVTIPNSLLSSGATYYFRAVSHASPSTISREYTFTTLAAEEYGDEEKTVDEGKVFGVSGSYQSVPNNNYSNVSYPRRVVQRVDDFVHEFIDSFSTKDNDKGKVKGEKDEKIKEKNAGGKLAEEEVFEEKSSLRIWWWLILLLLFLIIAGILYYHRKKIIKAHNKS